MKLRLETFDVTALEFGRDTAFRGGTLVVNRDDVCTLADEPRFIAGVRAELAAPGEPTRIIHVMDAVEPRIKLGGDTVAFPGFLGPPRTVGSGVTRRLRGVAVMASARLPKPPRGGALEFNEGIIDMSGPGAERCACSTTRNLVLVFSPRPDVTNEEFDNAVRLGTLRVARRLAETVLAGASPDAGEDLELPPVDPSLPRVAYVEQTQQQGVLVRTFLYGRAIETPSLIHPNEYFDGAIVSGNYRSMQKTPTWLRLDHPILRALYRRHGRDLNFVGVILCRGHYGDHEEKERNGYLVANLARLMGLQGVVQTLEGTGNTWIDFMLSARALEHLGIRSVQIVHELAGPEGRDWPVVEYTPEANAIVSGGNADEHFVLPAVKRVIGDGDLVFSSNEGWGRARNPVDEMKLSAHEMYAGFWMMQTNGFCAQAF